jgi:hypothetical protein
MARSECRCENFSCESSINSNQRFRFVKEDNCITDRIILDGIVYKSGLTENEIANCELKTRVDYKDKNGEHKLTGHDIRSVENDHRSGKSHRKHWNKVNHK